MRTLIIDNYDSFTHNLAQYIGEVNGEPCEVVRNDDSGFRMADLSDFDNVVISPGPGSPERPADFGVCAEVIRDSDLPLLGVCLGHQGLCQAYGGTVGPAPEVRHGRLSAVTHDGRDLFAGIPTPFDVVRYHSLAVTSLPDELEATAWAGDGTLMGVRHRHRPQWGVQFHPESICTEYGRRLLGNFAALTQQGKCRRTLSPRNTSRGTGAPLSSRAETPDGPSHRVLARRIRTAATAEQVFAHLYGASRNAFWLDSSRADSALGRFSFMGDASGPLARVVEHDVWRGVTTARTGPSTSTVSGPFLQWLDTDLRGLSVETPELPFDFALGWVGYLGYELKAECGGARSHRSEQPDAAMLFADRALAFDHHSGEVHLLALAEVGAAASAAAGTEAAQSWMNETEQRLRALPATPLRPVGIPHGAGTADGLTLRHHPKRYLDLIDAAQRQIRAGETYEVCLTNMLTGTAHLDPWESYRFLRETSPAPFSALLRFGDLSVLSTSPERFLKVGADGVAESKPIKGTRPRSADPREDQRLHDELLTSEKERAENLMIVDLVRNDLGSCAAPGAVWVHKLFDVESFATVHQLVSTVRARLDEGATALSCFRAAFPGGSMTGAPKIRTMRIIDELESGPRGIYSGAIGYFSLNGAADHSIVIRTLVAQHGRVQIGVGGAITSLSDAQEELTETEVKAAAFLRLFGQPFPGGDAVSR
ncbi:aminodeoxychorismate synthase component I [Streptomyces ochraceiscleroticus]|uniref:aminodeoxychorismate synthase n=1 Tax=Streptomyces ochraceiscleroticus TaxID=47761 RepID=A0ABW1MJ64_9ACTN|nr:aminodeoxychorismate synthase component I [Streptomyces ochraceiscleroticus]